jgi:hypothetical protein
MSAMTRSPLLLAVVVVGALALGACGSSNDGAGTGASKQPASRQDKAFDGAVKFAQCMREHGIDFPDPQRGANGLVRMMGPKNLNPNDPKLKSANSECQKFLQAGGGPAPDAATQAKARDAFVKFAQCMRQHGVDIPDPKSSGGGLTFQIGGKGGLNPQSPKFKAADKVCHSLLGAIGPGGGSGPGDATEESP